VTALAMLETDLVPDGGKETLFLTCAEYARKHGEYEAISLEFDKVELHLKSLGLLAPVTTEVMETKAAALARSLTDELILKR
jgi:hypothetical protein